MIASLYSISSDGVADYIWTKSAAPDECILDVGERRYQRKNTPFSYQNCTLVTLDNEVTGMLVAFPILEADGGAVDADPVLAP